jgi:hypothetical protein
VPPKLKGLRIPILEGRTHLVVEGISNWHWRAWL